MKTVWKYQWPLKDLVVRRVFLMPEGAEILCAKEQYEDICIWAMVDPEKSQVARKFQVVGTGHEMYKEPGQKKYIGTAMLRGGSLVLHCFEEV